MSSVLSSDGKIDPDVLAANATSAALMLSDIPWGGPIGVIRIGRIAGQFVVNPSMDEVLKYFLVFMKTFTSLFLRCFFLNNQSFCLNNFMSLSKSCNKKMKLCLMQLLFQDML